MKSPPENEHFERLVWHGPYEVAVDSKIKASSRGQLGFRSVPESIPENGLYVVIGDHHVHGARSLLYIGRSIELNRRVGGHGSWLDKEWRPEVYIAKVSSEKLNDIERLLIGAHSPPYNGTCVGEVPQLSPPLRVWNTGSFFKLLPEVSSSHPWCDNREDG